MDLFFFRFKGVGSGDLVSRVLVLVGSCVEGFVFGILRVGVERCRFLFLGRYFFIVFFGGSI